MEGEGSPEIATFPLARAYIFDMDLLGAILGADLEIVTVVFLPAPRC